MLGWRYRELYATKSTFITLALEDGADADVIEAQVTHTKTSRRAFDGYVRAQQWGKTCVEVAKLKIARRQPEFATSLATVIPLSAESLRNSGGGGGSRNLNETERLLHDQELGVLVDPTSSVVIW